MGSVHCRFPSDEEYGVISKMSDITVNDEVKMSIANMGLILTEMRCLSLPTL
jgi:hypothetical protein